VEAGQAGDQLLDDNGLAHAGAAEQAGLAAAHQRAEQVDDLDAGLEQLGFRGQLIQLRRSVVDRPALGGFHRAQAVDGLADQIEHPAEGLDAHGHADRRAGVEDGRAALEAVGRAEGDRADASAAEVLGHLAPERLLEGLPEHLAGHFDAQGVVDPRKLVLRELRVQGRTDDLGDLANIS
jgi:hypothetical protein